MGAAESRFSGWKRHGGGRRPAGVTAAMLFCVLRIFQCWHVLVRPFLRKLALVAVAAGLVFAPLPQAFAFGAQESGSHAALAAQEAAEHGHSHDGDEPHGPYAGHTHGHDPADHSHQYAHLSGGNGQWGLPPPQRWPSVLSGRPDGALGSGIERPPKRLMST